MRPAEYSTENPPRPIDCAETKEYINSLRRRIEVQNDQMEALASQVYALKGENMRLTTEVEKLSLDLGIQKEEVPPGTWVEVRK